MRKVLIASTFVIVAGLMAYYFQTRPQTGKIQIYANGPFVFKYLSHGPEGVVATFQGKDIHLSDLLAVSEPLTELYEQQAGHITKSLSKMPNFGQKSHSIELELKRDFSSDTIVRLDGKKLNRNQLDLDQIYFSYLQTKTFYLQIQILTEILQRRMPIKSADNPASSESAKLEVQFYFNLPQYRFHINSDVAFTQKEPEKKTIYIFSDLNCGPCRIFADDLVKIRNTFSKEIGFAFFNFPSDNDRFAPILSAAAICLGYQSTGYFWNFMEKIAGVSQPYDEAKILAAAAETGSDIARLKQCLNNRESAEKLKSQINAAKALGISQRPTMIIGTQVFASTINEEQVLAAIKELIDRPAVP